jgi:methylisocitrate lyase
MVDHLRRIVDAVDIPVFGDGDTGHGNVTNVARTIRLFENAGAAGLFIEDQVFPKRCGHMDGKQVVLAEEMCAKIKAAVDARRDPDLVIMARTDALAVYGLEAAIERGNRYREAGADLIFIEAPQSIDDMRRITKEVQAPLLANMVEGGKTPILSASELQAIGYSAVAFPLSTLYAAAWALREVMRKLAGEGSTKSHIRQMVVFEDFNHLVGLEEIRKNESRYYQSLFEHLHANENQ